MNEKILVELNEDTDLYVLNSAIDCIRKMIGVASVSVLVECIKCHRMIPAKEEPLSGEKIICSVCFDLHIKPKIDE